MAGRGGARPGAGRKPKRDKDPDAILAAEARIRSRLPALVDNMFTLADGVTVQETTAEGGTRIYTRPPDRQANEYLINRVMGKLAEPVKVSGTINVDVRLMSDEQLRAIVEEGGGG